MEKLTDEMLTAITDAFDATKELQNAMILKIKELEQRIAKLEQGEIK